jgi:hypothetical protein
MSVAGGIHLEVLHTADAFSLRIHNGPPDRVVRRQRRARSPDIALAQGRRAIKD